MLHRAADFGLALQPLIELRRFALVFELLLYLDGLQRDAPADSAVAREVHHPHSPFAEDGFNFVIAELAPGFGREIAHFPVQTMLTA